MAVYGSPYCLSQPPTKLIEEDFADVDAMNDYRVPAKPTPAMKSVIRGGTLWDSGLRDREDIASILETDDMESFDEGLRYVIHRTQCFVRERQSLAADGYGGLGPVGGIYLPRLGRLVIWQKFAYLDTTRGENPYPCVLFENTSTSSTGK
ncbi:hypothetical protein FOZ60_007699 [Perkinsus olseni]|uniref:Uncharacterized protein n=1 Tax=Perkinsus olseni TaxID=32597 RepID=A0A7J6NM95_PEROL|nr:hypothetical protein FOZ60_007699 [Perkinsus olseni]